MDYGGIFALGKVGSCTFAESKAQRDASPRAIPPRGHPPTVTFQNELAFTRWRTCVGLSPRRESCGTKCRFWVSPASQ
jgi:hypothetical protein